MSGFLSVKNFARYQHYRNRRPPWIKFYRELLDPHNKLNDLPVATRYLYDRLLLLAAEWENVIPNDPELIAKLLRMPTGSCREGLAHLVKGGWLSQKQTRRRASKPDSGFARAEKETERDKTKPQAVNEVWIAGGPAIGGERPSDEQIGTIIDLALARSEASS